MVLEQNFLKSIMKVDYCFILAAGFGTRMGEIGKELPKLLWPVFERPLLELQIEFARSLGIEDIAFNCHHQADKILKHPSLKNATALYEPEVLDIGGGIHNFAKEKNYQGHALILNADQFLIFDKSFLDSLEDKGQVATLFTKTVLKSESYNKLEIKDHFLKAIIPNSEIKEESFETYSGCAVINLARLRPSEGKSPFFQTVANFKQEKVLCVNTDRLEYNDFGTKDRYFECIQEVLAGKRPRLKDFLLQTKSFQDNGEKSFSYSGLIKVNENAIALDGQNPAGNARFFYKNLKDT